MRCGRVNLQIAFFRGYCTNIFTLRDKNDGFIKGAGILEWATAEWQYRCCLLIYKSSWEVFLFMKKLFAVSSQRLK